MHLHQLKRARKLPIVGDIFVWKPKSTGQYGFARLIKDDTRIGHIEGVFLIYVYKALSPDPAHMPRLSKSQLLIAPIGVHRSAWTMGLLQYLKHEPLVTTAVLKQHCFWDEWDKCYYDEYGMRLRRRTRPCGFWAMCNYAALDFKIAAALGLPE